MHIPQKYVQLRGTSLLLERLADLASFSSYGYFHLVRTSANNFAPGHDNTWTPCRVSLSCKRLKLESFIISLAFLYSSDGLSSGFPEFCT